MVTHITTENFDSIVNKSKKPVVIDIYATWCGPCQQMKPLFEILSNEMGEDYVFVSLNVDEAREIAIQYGVTTIPTFIFIQNGSVKGKEVGYLSKDTLKAKIEQYFNRVGGGV